VPNCSSAAVTCEIAGCGSPTLFRASPFESVLVAASSSFDERAQRPALAEPITTVITDALPRASEGFTTRAPLSHAGPN
jgi:hypothetical protein